MPKTVKVPKNWYHPRYKVFIEKVEALSDRDLVLLYSRLITKETIDQVFMKGNIITKDMKIEENSNIEIVKSELTARLKSK